LDFTAIVVTWNSAHEVRGLIESVDRHLAGRCQLLFVDNDSGDDTLKMIGKHAPRSQVIPLDRNAGFGPANNIGVRATTADVVVLLNPDTVIVDDSLCALAELASLEWALFEPRLLNEDGSVQISASPALASWQSALISIWPGALMPKRIRAQCEPWRYDERLHAGWIPGTCLVAQRKLLLEFGPFDERLVLYGEDADLSLRAWQAGVPSVSAPDVARVVHLGGRSGSQAFTDNGMQRKVEVRWWIVRERLGLAHAVSDLVMQFLLFGSRWLIRRLLRQDAEIESTWLRAAARAIGTRRPRAPAPLSD
jgi:N-acetylglucosaminyl-diphospho-decaprenol L-rhamnosyltransferase